VSPTPPIPGPRGAGTADQAGGYTIRGAYPVIQPSHARTPSAYAGVCGPRATCSPVCTTSRITELHTGNGCPCQNGGCPDRPKVHSIARRTPNVNSSRSVSCSAGRGSDSFTAVSAVTSCTNSASNADHDGAHRPSAFAAKSNGHVATSVGAPTGSSRLPDVGRGGGAVPPSPSCQPVASCARSDAVNSRIPIPPTDLSPVVAPVPAGTTPTVCTTSDRSTHPDAPAPPSHPGYPLEDAPSMADPRHGPLAPRAARGSDPQAPAARASDAAGHPTVHTLHEAAAVLRVRKSWLERQAAARKIPFTMLGGAYHFTTDHLLAIIRMHEVTPTGREETPSATRPTRRPARPARPKVHPHDIDPLRARPRTGPRRPA
jgi:hypothetical protein